MQKQNEHWFPAKRHGWGWGFPITWQGWVVLAIFAVLAISGVFIFPPRQELSGLLLYLLVLNAALFATCWLKGERRNGAGVIKSATDASIE